MNLDTTFLIDLHRDYRGRKNSGARAFLLRNPEIRFHISTIVAVEFLEGVSAPADARFLDAFVQIPFDEAMAREAATLRRTLREKGELIGDFDILIAATARFRGEPLVTANLDHFRRISGLECVPYRVE